MNVTCNVVNLPVWKLWPNHEDPCTFVNVIVKNWVAPFFIWTLYLTRIFCSWKLVVCRYDGSDVAEKPRATLCFVWIFSCCKQSVNNNLPFTIDLQHLSPEVNQSSFISGMTERKPARCDNSNSRVFGKVTYEGNMLTGIFSGNVNTFPGNVNTVNTMYVRSNNQSRSWVWWTDRRAEMPRSIARLQPVMQCAV